MSRRLSQTEAEAILTSEKEELDLLLDLDDDEYLLDDDEDSNLSSNGDEVNDSLIRDVLEGRSPEFRSEVLKVAYRSGIEKDDPLWSVMVATGQLESLLHEKPEEIKRIVALCSEGLKKDVEVARAFVEQSVADAERSLSYQAEASVKLQQKNISAATKILVRQAALEKISYDIYALVKGGLVTLAAVGVGIVLGFLASSMSIRSQPQPELDPTGTRQLTLEEAISLDWATSKEGKFAKQFMQWNQTLLSGKEQRVCEREVERLGVTLVIEGREAIDGFCTLWVKPPGQVDVVE